MEKVEIQVSKDGPYMVKGDFELKDADGKIIPLKDKAVALCRCGGSKNKPFCDGTHLKAHFKG